MYTFHSPNDPQVRRGNVQGSPGAVLILSPRMLGSPCGGVDAMRTALALVILSFVAVGTGASAQGRTGTIAGMVTGDDGNRLPAVTIVVENSAAAVRRSATTDADGRY